MPLWIQGLDGCVELGPGLNIVAGPNCSGKTAIVEALAYLLALSYSNLREAHGYLALLHAARGSSPHSIASLVQDKGSVKGIVQTRDREEVVELELEREVSYEAVGSTIRPVVEVKMVSKPRGCEIVYRLLSNGHVNLGMHARCVEGSRVSVAVVTPGMYPYDFFDKLVGMAKRNRDRVWSTLSKGIEIDGTTYAVDVASDDWGQLAAYVIEHGQPVTFYAVGRGLQRALIMLAALEYADIVMIDEIESAMHPELLMNVAERIARIARNSKQVIVTTQSLEAARSLAAASMGLHRSEWRQLSRLAERLEQVCKENEEQNYEGDLRISLVSLKKEKRRLKSVTMHGCSALREIVAGEDMRLIYTLIS
ncbi:MAG: ATP-binding protein [Crenarchaeota archaeon]|nr:ATP-binding protein [Thermoproteota archaeon]